MTRHRDGACPRRAKIRGGATATVRGGGVLVLKMPLGYDDDAPWRYGKALAVLYRIVSDLSMGWYGVIFIYDGLFYPLAKMGYYVTMLDERILFILRLLLIAAVWVFVWRLIQPKTQTMRILRAVLLVLALLTVLAVTRVTGY